MDNYPIPQLDTIKYSIHDKLSALEVLMDSLGDSKYSKQLDILKGGTVGKHIRHIIEFYEMFMHGIEGQDICYDDRKHNPDVETVVAVALEKLAKIKYAILELDADYPIVVTANYTPDPANSQKIPSSLSRELAYNLDHTIHHFAIVKLAVIHTFPDIEIPANFDLAYSTINYAKA